MLQINLEAALQAYGRDVGTIDDRQTWRYPSKSAVVGMIARGGAFYTDDEQIRQLDEALAMTVYVMRAGRLLADFQTVMGSRSADRKLRDATIIGERQYLTNARFVVALDGPHAVLEFVAACINQPQRIIALGRACCLPSVPVVAVFAEEEPDGWIERVTECLPSAAGAIMVRDRVLVASARSFRPRWICVTQATPA